MGKRVIVDLFAESLDRGITAEWVSSVFLQPHTNMDLNKKISKFYSSADSKFTDTTLGGNISMNTRSQYCRYTDPRRLGLSEDTVEVTTTSSGTNIGMGRYYSKAHDDAQNTLILSFGVAEFNSPFSFYSRAISYPDAMIVNQGRSPLLYHAANVLGTAARYKALPMFSVALAIADVARLVVGGTADTRFFTLKHEMVSYWSTVGSLVNYLSVERGNALVTVKTSAVDRISTNVTLSSDDLEALSKVSDGIISKTGYIDAFAVANRTASRVTKRMKAQIESIEGQDGDNYAFGKVPVNTNPKTLKEFAEDVNGLGAYIEYKYEPNEEKVPVTGEGISKEDFDKKDSTGRILRVPADDRKAPNQEMGFWESVSNYFSSTVSTGGSYARLNVEYTGATSITFTNTLKDIAVKNAFNAASSTSRDIRFNMSGGNTGVDLVDGVKNAVVDTLAGLSNGVSAGLSNVLIGLLGGGMLDIPKMWDDSTVELNQHSYKIVLTCPYNNPISLMMKLDFIVAMLITAVSARSTGSSSYGSPYICSAYLKGVQDTDLAMMTDLTLTAGGGNTGRGRNSVPLTLEATFKITELSNVITTPTPSGLFGAFELSLDDTKPLNRYLNTFAGRDFNTSKYIKPKVMKRLAKLERDIESTFNPNRLGLYLADSIIGSAAAIVKKDLLLN